MYHINRYQISLKSIKKVYKKLERKSSNLFFSQKNQNISNNDSSSINNSEPRFNEAKVQMINEETREYLFGNKKNKDKDKIERAKEHLQKFNLLEKNRDPVNDVTNKIQLPKLLGKNIEEHFKIIAHKYTDKYIKITSMLISVDKLPEIPTNFNFSPGWTK